MSTRCKIWKDALLPGVWVTAKGQVFECTETDLRHFHDRTKEQIKHGAPIPWTWEHQHDDNGSKQLSASDLLAKWAQNTGGHIHDVRLGDDGALEVLMDVDDADRPKLEATKYVSPDIRHNWRDRNGPESDALGPYWPGQSFAHIAVTPMPVQYPQRPFDFSAPVSLSSANVDVSLSSALQLSSGPKMAAKPKKDDAAPADAAPPADAPPDAAPPADAPPDDQPGSDLDGGGSADASSDGALIQAFAEAVGHLGIAIYATPDTDLKTAVEHFISAFKTHKSVSEMGDADNQDPNNPQNPMEPEVAENPPIMMSATPSPREQKLAAKLLAQSTKGLGERIAVLHARGFIDDAMRRELIGELGEIKLSAADLTEECELKPLPLMAKIAVLERLMKTGKPGSFERPGKKTGAINPNKPISSSVALSSAEEVVEAPYGAEEQEDRKAQEAAGDDLAARTAVKTRAA